MTTDPSLISVTAKLAAYYRQFSDIAFAKDAAEWIGANEAFEQILRDHGLERDQLTFYAPLFEARYKSIDGVIRELGAPQVLELASGYSLRGLDLTRGGSIRYAEADLPGVVAMKLQLLADLRQRHGLAPNPRHTVAAANALELEQVRSAARFDRTQALMVLCEGLIGYLTREETARLAANMRSLLADGAGGWWVTPDFTFRADVRGLRPERLRLREAVTGITQRQLDASAFEDADDLRAFLHDAGFDVGLRTGISRVWVMTPISRARS